MTNRNSQILKGAIFLVLLMLVGLLGLVVFLFYTFDFGKPQNMADQVSIRPETQTSVLQQEELIVEEGLESRTYRFEYGCQDYTLTLPIYRSIYDYFSRLDKYVYSAAISQEDLEKKYYTQFILNDQDEEIIDLIINQVDDISRAQNSDELAAALVSFVQFIEYDCNKLFSYENLENHDYQTNFPYETLYLNSGVCGDTSILLAKLLKGLGYGTAFLIFEDQSHMALGIQCPHEHGKYIKDGRAYCYIETTAPSRIGVEPVEISDSRAYRIIVVSDGKVFRKMSQLADQMKAESNQYGSYILGLSTCAEISQYQTIYEKQQHLESYQTDLSQLESEINSALENYNYAVEQYNQQGCKGKVSKSKYNKCMDEKNYLDSLYYTYEAIVIDYNNLVDEHNILYDNYLVDVQTFDNLIASTHSSCSGITYGGESLETIEAITE